MRFKDPICGVMVDEKKMKFISEFGGIKFYFCSSFCKATFYKDPKKYTKV